MPKKALNKKCVLCAEKTVPLFVMCKSCMNIWEKFPEIAKTRLSKVFKYIKD